jgi:hypothetical protein
MTKDSFSLQAKLGRKNGNPPLDFRVVPIAPDKRHPVIDPASGQSVVPTHCLEITTVYEPKYPISGITFRATSEGREVIAHLPPRTEMLRDGMTLSIPLLTPNPSSITIDDLKWSHDHGLLAPVHGSWGESLTVLNAVPVGNVSWHSAAIELGRRVIQEGISATRQLLHLRRGAHPSRDVP